MCFSILYCDNMICPHCNEKITKLTADQIWTGEAYLDEDGNVQIEQGNAINEMDKDSNCDIEYPRYLCDNCGTFITSNTDEAKKILEEAKEK